MTGATAIKRFAATLAILLVVLSPSGAAERLIHAEDFSKTSKWDASFWVAETGFFRNKEAQYYRPENVCVKAGALVFEARRVSAPNAAFDPNAKDWPANVRNADYTSGSLVSRNAFPYGVFEIVARFPQSAGVWPAIWLIHDEGAPFGEIDIAESVGATPGEVFTTIHAGPDVHSLKDWQTETPAPDLASAFHAYRLEWSRDAIHVSIDGRRVLDLDPDQARRDGFDPLRAPMHLRINLALGGSWGGKIDDSALPARLAIKSVKVWSAGP